MVELRALPPEGETAQIGMELSNTVVVLNYVRKQQKKPQSSELEDFTNSIYNMFSLSFIQRGYPPKKNYLSTVEKGPKRKIKKMIEGVMQIDIRDQAEQSQPLQQAGELVSNASGWQKMSLRRQSDKLIPTFIGAFIRQ